MTVPVGAPGTDVDDGTLDDELVHHYCCNPDTALCGEDLRDGEDRNDESSYLCVVCVDLAPQPCEITCPVVVFT